MSNVTRLTLGADPERFVYNEITGKIVPVCGWLGGTKAAPVPLGPEGSGMFVQEDNVMAEYNIPPSPEPARFSKSIMAAELALTRRIRRENKAYSLSGSNRARFTLDELSQYPQAMLFGCSPEFDAYREGAQVHRESMSPELHDLDGTPMTERYAGGHLHLGLTDEAGKYALGVPRFVIAAFCDARIGLAVAPRDHQPGRRELYGQAGRFRPTPYGIEYRVLSNFWATHEEYAALVAHEAFELMRTLSTLSIGELQRLFDEIPWGDVRQSINNEDARMARQLHAHIWTDISRRIAA